MIRSMMNCLAQRTFARVFWDFFVRQMKLIDGILKLSTVVAAGVSSERSHVMESLNGPSFSTFALCLIDRKAFSSGKREKGKHNIS